MKKYKVKETITITVEKGSIVILTDAQAALVASFISETKSDKDSDK